jgi:hypothetical protein
MGGFDLGMVLEYILHAEQELLNFDLFYSRSQD